jgi:hypothetical protein
VVPTPTITLLANDDVKLSLERTSRYAASVGLSGMMLGAEKTSPFSLKLTDVVTTNGARVHTTRATRGRARRT